MGDELRLVRRHIGEALFKDLADSGLKPLTLALQKSPVGNVPHQGVLEDISGVNPGAAPVDQL